MAIIEKVEESDASPDVSDVVKNPLTAQIVKGAKRIRLSFHTAETKYKRSPK